MSKVSCFWCLSWLACFLSSLAGYAVKTHTYYLEKLQLSPPQKLPVSYVFLRSATHYLPRIWDHKLVSDVSAPPDFRQCQPLLEIQATCKSMSITFTLGCVHKIWNYDEWNLRPNFVTEFVDPVKSTGIFYLNYSSILTDRHKQPKEKNINQNLNLTHLLIYNSQH